MASRFVAFVLLTSILAAGCSSDPKDPTVPVVPPVEGVDAEGFAPVLFDGVSFQEQDLGVVDGLRVHGDVYLPTGPLDSANAPTAFPTILLLSPYWAGGTGGNPIGYTPYDFLVERLLPRGYAVVFGDLGGNGGSAGCWDFMGPTERQSAVAMVKAITQQPWSDGKVGMMGLSYDGMTQVMAASDQAPGLVTVVPASALTEAYRGLQMGGVHYGADWHATIPGYEQSSLMGPGVGNQERQQGWLETIQSSPPCVVDNTVGDDPAGAYSSYYQARDFRELGKQVKASVFVTQGFFDPAVKPDNYGEWFHNVPTLKKVWLGFWFHQYPTAQNAGRDDMYLTLHRWFDHELKGIQNGIDQEPVVDVQDSLGNWRHEDAWPPADAVPAVFRLGSDGVLAPGDAAGGSIVFGGPTGLLDLTVGMGSSSTSIETSALPGPLHIAGQPVLEMDIASSSVAGSVIARLWDGGRLVSQGALDLQFAADPAQMAVLTPLSPVHAVLTFYPTDWVLAAGHTLRLELSNVDADMWFDPDLTLSQLTVSAGPTATLTLPTVARADDTTFLHSCGASLADAVAGCFLDLEDKGVETAN